MNKSITTVKYWNKYWNKSKIKTTNLFSDLFIKYLTKNNKFKVIEIGCIPGRFLVNFNKLLGYKICGVDFADMLCVKQLFKQEKIRQYTLWKKDFLKFNSGKYDVVSSFGFIEHFEDYEPIFRRHVELLKRNGFLFLEMPNFNHLQGKAHILLDKKNYRRHNIEIMDLKVLHKLCEKYNLKIIYLDYYKTIDFFTDKNDHSMFFNLIINGFHVFFKIINKLINISNKQTSPYIILIAKSLN